MSESPEEIKRRLRLIQKKAAALIDSSEDRELLNRTIQEYLRSYNVRLLVQGLSEVINSPARFELFDDVRPIVVSSQQMEYNLRAPYVTHRPRFVRLTRREGVPFGFAVRGGREHETGIYVSHVELQSEADKQGLKVGDQLIRLNGLSLEKAIHREVSSLIKSRTSLTLKVKTTGMFPVKESEKTRSLADSMEKSTAPVVRMRRAGISLTRAASESAVLEDEDESPLPLERSSSMANMIEGLVMVEATRRTRKKSDPLSWRIVESPGPSPRKSVSPPVSPTCLDPVEAKLVVHLFGKDSIGCSVTKGPPERPGIFIQSSREGGPAHAAGMRPGDQIMSCNGRELTSLDFAEVLYMLKASRQLSLVVRKGVAYDLISGESSGYESESASGDGATPSPIISDRKRLSAVSEEEVFIRENTDKPRVQRHLSVDRHIDWQAVEDEWERAEEMQGMGIYLPVLFEARNVDADRRSTKSSTDFFDPHFEFEKIHLEEEKKKLKEESERVEREKQELQEEKKEWEEIKRKLSVASSISSTPSSDDTVVQERMAKQSTTLMTGPDTFKKSEKLHHHEKLMEEFRQVHHRMFSPDDLTTNQVSGKEKEVFTFTKEELEALSPKQVRFSGKPQIGTFDFEVNESSREIVVRKISVPPLPPPLPDDKPLRRKSVPSKFSVAARNTLSPELVDPFATLDKMPPPPPPPSAYFEGDTPKGGVRISFNEYPKPGQLPPPTKLDFLPPKENSTLKEANPSGRSVLQDELSQTLSRSKLKQRMSSFEISGEIDRASKRQSTNGILEKQTSSESQNGDTSAKRTSVNGAVERQLSTDKTTVAEATAKPKEVASKKESSGSTHSMLMQEVIQKFGKQTTKAEPVLAKLHPEQNGKTIKESTEALVIAKEVNSMPVTNGVTKKEVAVIRKEEVSSGKIQSTRLPPPSSSERAPLNEKRPQFTSEKPTVSGTMFQIQTYDSAERKNVRTLAGKFETKPGASVITKAPDHKVTIILKEGNDRK